MINKARFDELMIGEGEPATELEAFLLPLICIYYLAHGTIVDSKKEKVDMLTGPQLVVLKASILADIVLDAHPNNSDGASAIAAALNLVSTPAYTVWRTNVPVAEIMLNGFDWTRVDNLSAGKARIWDWMTQFGVIDASKLNIRAGIDATWIGTVPDLAVRTAVYAHCKRPATVIEKLLAFGTGTDAAPATMAFEGQISYQEVETARNLP